MWRLCSPLYSLIFLVLFVGCMDADVDQAKKPGSILGKKTQDIGEFDPNAGREVSDSKVRATNPLTGPLEALGPMMEKVSKLGIDHSLASVSYTHLTLPTIYSV